MGRSVRATSLIFLWQLIMKQNLSLPYNFVIFISIILGCKDEPMNLSTARQHVKDYYESGKYDEELNSIIENAKDEFESVDIKENSVVLFDVDDTALSGYDIGKKMGFGYDFEIVREWEMKGVAPVIPQVKGLYDYLIDRGAKVIFLTGRRNASYAATFKNLKDQGYTLFDTLITRSDSEYKTPPLDYKNSKRVELTKKGYTIIGTVGDQWSDLEGQFHGVQVKIPNYLYLVED